MKVERWSDGTNEASKVDLRSSYNKPDHQSNMLIRQSPATNVPWNTNRMLDSYPRFGPCPALLSSSVPSDLINLLVFALLPPSALFHDAAVVPTLPPAPPAPDEYPYPFFDFLAFT